MLIRMHMSVISIALHVGKQSDCYDQIDTLYETHSFTENENNREYGRHYTTHFNIHNRSKAIPK